MFRDSSAGNFSKLTTCPVCDEPRYKPEKKTPVKRFKYLSVSTRLKHLFSTCVTFKLLKSHADSETIEDKSSIAGIHASPAWKEWYAKDGMFGGDPWAIFFALCADNVNPFSNEKTNNSMCPIFLIPLNLPNHIQTKTGSMMLTGIIPGRKEPKDMDPYIDLLSTTSCL